MIEGLQLLLVPIALGMLLIVATADTNQADKRKENDLP